MAMSRPFAESKKKYNPDIEGYGNPRNWRNDFHRRMNKDEAKTILDEDDPYTLLNIKRDSTKEEIKSAYRKQAKIWHPDLNPGNELFCTEMMKKINAAYWFLLG